MAMRTEFLKIKAEEVNYLIYFGNVKYELAVLALVVLIGAPIVYFYSSSYDTALGIIIGMVWISFVKMIGFSYKRNDG
jgi:hypothetical protein